MYDSIIWKHSSYNTNPHQLRLFVVENQRHAEMTNIYLPTTFVADTACFLFSHQNEIDSGEISIRDAYMNPVFLAHFAYSMLYLYLFSDSPFDHQSIVLSQQILSFISLALNLNPQFHPYILMSDEKSMQMSWSMALIAGALRLLLVFIHWKSSHFVATHAYSVHIFIFIIY